MPKPNKLPHPTRHYAEIHKRAFLWCWDNITPRQRDLVGGGVEDEVEAFTEWVNHRANEVYLNPEHRANDYERWMSEQDYFKRVA